MSVNAPLIRVCRKRSADPQTALLVSVKRQRPSAAQADPLLYQLLTTSDTPLAPKDNAKVKGGGVFVMAKEEGGAYRLSVKNLQSIRRRVSIAMWY